MNVQQGGTNLAVEIDVESIVENVERLEKDADTINKVPFFTNGSLMPSTQTVPVAEGGLPEQTEPPAPEIRMNGPDLEACEERCDVHKSEPEHVVDEIVEMQLGVLGQESPSPATCSSDHPQAASAHAAPIATVCAHNDAYIQSLLASL